MNNNLHHSSQILDDDKYSTMEQTSSQIQVVEDDLNEYKKNINLQATQREEIELKNTEIVQTINTNISDYSVDDIFKLLDININDFQDYNDLKEAIDTKINKYVLIFKNKELIDFFEDVRKSLLNIHTSNENITEAEQLLLSYGKKSTGDDQSTETSGYFGSGDPTGPVNRKTVTKLLTVDSRFRSNYTKSSSSNYTIDLPYIMKNVIEIKLSDLEFPTTFYPFDEDFHNNYFWLKYCYYMGDNLVEKYVYIFIPSGNYYHTSFIDTVQQVFTDNGIPITIVFDLDYNNLGGVGEGTGKVTLGLDTDSSYNLFEVTEIELNFYGSHIPPEYLSSKVSQLITDDDLIKRFYNKPSPIEHRQRMGWMLGFREKIYKSNTTYIAEAIMDILGPKYVYLVLDDLNTSSNINFFMNQEESLLDGNIFARISLKGYPFSVQAQGDYRAYSEPRYYYGPVNIHKLRVKIIDEFGRHVSLNGMDFSFTLSVTLIYSTEA